MKHQHVRQAILCITLAWIGCATNLTLLFADDIIEDKVLEVGRAMGWSEAYVNRSEGLFIWWFRVKAPSPAQSGRECDGLFTWYIKRVGDKVALHDPVQFLPNCPREQKQWLATEARSLQEDFKRRWLASVGPVTLIGPTSATHSADIEAEAWARLIKERSAGPAQSLPVK